MKYLIFFSCLVVFSCVDRDAEEFKKSCPYDLRYSGHWLRVPITISPHKMTYKIGDTINISTIFSDSIKDIGTQQTFKIQGFPFRPLTVLYRFYEGLKWDSGYPINNVSIDSVYKPYFFSSGHRASGFRAQIIYEEGMYRFVSELILKKKGRYIIKFTDKYMDNLSGGNGERNVEADAITFEGKCPTLGYYLCYMIEGNNHLKDFEDELTYLDEVINYGGLRSEYGLDFLKFGKRTVEYFGFFGFEVIE